MEKREDVQDMIGSLESGLKYAGIVSQVPSLHGWIIGNLWVSKFLAAQPFLKVGDPLRTMVQVSL